ncbi:hypothetical protein GCM10027053_12770 [Intrasporangium mesophilum]
MSDVSGADAPTTVAPMSPEVADQLAARLLGDLRTRLGGLHIAHARRVAHHVRETDDAHAVPVALLHDVVEKGAISLHDLLEQSGDERLVGLVDLLTKRDDETEEQYLSRVVADPVALEIKRADLVDKGFHDDAVVDDSTALDLWLEARGKLELLERLAREGGHATE